MLGWEVLDARLGSAQLGGVWYLVGKCSVGRCLVLSWEVLSWEVVGTWLGGAQWGGAWCLVESSRLHAHTQAGFACSIPRS